MKTKKRQNGFTLMEVVMACTILAIAMVPILKALTQSYVTSTLIEKKSVSLMHAQAILDEISATTLYNWGSVNQYDATDYDLGNGYLCTINDDMGTGSMFRTITVKTGYDSDSNGDLANPDEILITLKTIIAKRE